MTRPDLKALLLKAAMLADEKERQCREEYRGLLGASAVAKEMQELAAGLRAAASGAGEPVAWAVVGPSGIIEEDAMSALMVYDNRQDAEDAAVKMDETVRPLMWAVGLGAEHCPGCEASRREGENCTPECPSICCDHVPCPGIVAASPGAGEACRACGGTGYDDDDRPVAEMRLLCVSCGGSGRSGGGA